MYGSLLSLLVLVAPSFAFVTGLVLSSSSGGSQGWGFRHLGLILMRLWAEASTAFNYSALWTRSQELHFFIC